MGFAWRDDQEMVWLAGLLSQFLAFQTAAWMLSHDPSLMERVGQNVPPLDVDLS